MSLLTVTNLEKAYASPEGLQNRIINVPHFEIDAGKQIALRGSSGAGKTTFLNLIAGILQADRGHIVVAGEEMTALPESGRDGLRARHIGYIFQTFNLLAGYTALENVMLGMMFGKGIDTNFAQHLLERVGLGDRMQYRPSQLSVGQQQRVAVARAVANRPRLVLADEPTGNLDYHHANEAVTLIREICHENNAALLIVSHDSGVLGQFEDAKDFAQVNCV
ncbi:ABC transporter ATP-binding protein [Candidatus Poribacteria bacterium]|nr:MAG: ABC transporter ATP-binding protein [Candidatus Poribacteria bacterium]